VHHEGVQRAPLLFPAETNPVKLYLMRHGTAEDQADSGLDGDRALTLAGRERVRLVAKALQDADEGPAHVVSSPLVRAVQTAEIVAIKTKLAARGGTIEVRRELSPGGEAAQFVRLFPSEGRKRTLLVGHEPDLSELVSALLGSTAKPLDKAMVVGLQLSETARPRLRFVLDPKTLQFESFDS
jgi:phosphohistidine phosphatase